jgi:uncharacterized surface protein with fasciclin (FAS1) repeats
MLTTVEGERLAVMQSGDGTFSVTDSKGGVAHVTIPDVVQSNGVILVVDKVLLPS